MIKFGRNSGSEQPTPTEPSKVDLGYQYATESAAASSRAVTDSESIARDIKEGRLSGFVGHGTILTGETNFQMMLRVDGHLTGKVSSDGGTLLVGANGQVDANISVAAAIINGAVNGDILATEKIQLGRSARVVGNIQAPRLVLEDGAVLEGGCSMIKARETLEKRETEAKSGYTTSQQSAYEEEELVETDEADDYLDTDDDEEEDEETAEAATTR